VARAATLRTGPWARVRLGHATTPDGRTGVSTLLLGRSASTVVDVRGGASGTYDTASLSLEATFGRRWAVFLSGGSLFGLDAGAGVRSEVLRRGGGQVVFGRTNRVAPISGAILYDLPLERATPPDYRALGELAARSAQQVSEQAGRMGAAAGARIGKYLGRGTSQPGGLAVRVRAEARFGTVAVLAVLNSVGAVRDPTNGRWVAGARGSDGTIVPPPGDPQDAGPGTTLIAAVTDVAAPRSVLQRAATYAHTALGRTVAPAHTATDGDAVFVTSLRDSVASPKSHAPAWELADRLGGLVERATTAAILAAAEAATPPEPVRRAAAVSRAARG
jgi:L-aminopeptidase/D-esterase-like protein